MNIQKKWYLSSIKVDESPLIDRSLSVLLKHYLTWTQGTLWNIKNRWDHKLRHTIGVLYSGNKILDLIKKNEKILELTSKTETKARVSLILHDLWRFYQNDWNNRILKDNKDFKDWKIFNHWEWGYDISKKEWFPEDICLAVKYHNKKDIKWLFEEEFYKNLKTEVEKEELKFLVEITRDSDKITNMIHMVYEPNRISRLDESNKWNDINSRIIENFKNNESVNNEDVKSSIDVILRQYAFIFDINNKKESFNILKDSWYFTKIKEILNNEIKKELKNNENNKKLKQIFTSVDEYLNNYMKTR